MLARTALTIRHVLFEDLGTFAPVLEDAGYETEYRDAGVDDFTAHDMEAADLLIVLGAPIGVYEDALYPFLKTEIAGLEQRLAKKKPTLGICLGAQLMARALGARVYPNGGKKEIGWSKLDLTPEGRQSPLRHLENRPVLHWHGDTFDLPQGARLLASTPITQNQAFDAGPHALALQFHAEAKGETFERWLIGHACEIGGVKTLSVNTLRDDTQRHAPALEPHSHALLREWLEAQV